MCAVAIWQAGYMYPMSLTNWKCLELLWYYGNGRDGKIESVAGLSILTSHYS